MNTVANDGHDKLLQVNHEWAVLYELAWGKQWR